MINAPFAARARRRLLTMLMVAGLAVAAAAPAAQAHHYDHMLPPPGTCGSAESGDMSKTYWEWTVAGMCLIEHARVKAGRSRPIWPYALQASSYRKASDIAVCQPDPNNRDAVHTACGRRMDYHLDWGRPCTGGSGFWENVYIGNGSLSTARAAVSAWLHSDGHRENLLRPSWNGGVLSYSGPGTYRDRPDTRVWVYHMGYCN